MEIESGPNWDDDLSGSNVYAPRTQPEGLSAEERPSCRASSDGLLLPAAHLQPLPERACVAACPSGAIYKRARTASSS